MPRKISAYIPPLIGMVIFSLAVTVLHHELKTYHCHDIIRALKSIPPITLALATGIMLLNYFILSITELVRLPVY
jgi:uncharacterized membrane protein YbhN (UPF0104 family)